MTRKVKVIAVIVVLCLLAIEPVAMAQKARGARRQGGGLKERFNASARGGGRLRERFNDAARRNTSKVVAVSSGGGRRESFNKIGKEGSKQSGNGKKSSSGGDKSGTTGRSSTPPKPTFETPTNKKRPKNSGPKL